MRESEVNVADDGRIEDLRGEFLIIPWHTSIDFGPPLINCFLQFSITM